MKTEEYMIPCITFAEATRNKVAWPASTATVSHIDSAIVLHSTGAFTEQDLADVRAQFHGRRVTLDGDTLTVWPRRHARTARLSARARSRFAAVTVTIALTLGASGCGGGGGNQHFAIAARSGTPANTGNGSSLRTQQGQTPLAELSGQSGLLLSVTSADREPGGYLTVRGQLRNDSAVTVTVPAELRGNELSVLKQGSSLGGATLVDFAHQKRYYVLRDTTGRPLTTTGLSYLKAGESVTVFMQFPAPPSGTKSVNLQLPLFDSADIPLAG